MSCQQTAAQNTHLSREHMPTVLTGAEILASEFHFFHSFASPMTKQSDNKNKTMLSFIHMHNLPAFVSVTLISNSKNKNKKQKPHTNNFKQKRKEKNTFLSVIFFIEGL